MENISGKTGEYIKSKVTVFLGGNNFNSCYSTIRDLSQVYMMAIVVVMPTIVMTFAYTAISLAVSLFSTFH